jgi:plasmid stability protein
MKKMVVELPSDVFRRLKLHAVEHDITIKAVVTEVLRKHLGMKELGETEKK